MNTPIKPNRPEEVSKGLGDSIEKFTKLTGIKKLVEVIEVETGGGCGCDKRKDKLNEMFPYKRKNYGR